MARDAKNIIAMRPQLSLNKIRLLWRKVRFLQQQNGCLMLRNPRAQVLSPGKYIGTDYMKIGPNLWNHQICEGIVQRPTSNMPRHILLSFNGKLNCLPNESALLHVSLLLHQLNRLK